MDSDVITNNKISHIDRFPYFLTRSAPSAFGSWSSAIINVWDCVEIFPYFGLYFCKLSRNLQDHKTVNISNEVISNVWVFCASI